MKRIILLPIFGMFIVLSFWSLSLAQAGGCGGHSKTNESAQASGCGGNSQMDHSGDMGMGDMTDMDMMKDMSRQCQMMSAYFENLEDHFQKMMQIDDSSELKMEMQKHLEMINQIHDKMAAHSQMCQSMTPMMTGAEVAHAAKGNNNSDHDTHNH